MRKPVRSYGKILLGLVSVILGGMAGMLAVVNLDGGLDAEVVFLAGFALLLLYGGAHSLWVGRRGDPVPARGPEGGSGLVRFTVVAVLASPVVLALGVPSMCGCSPERGDYAAVKSDLRNFLSAQEIYFGDGNYTYAGDLATLQLSESEGVHVTITGHGGDGYGATATHDDLPGVTCAVYAGDAYRVEPATEPVVVTCN